VLSSLSSTSAVRRHSIKVLEKKKTKKVEKKKKKKKKEQQDGRF
jgi:hypothetical protein